ncbi:MAG: hypothetical protein U0103_09265 [Candidatus Obscuribacterales bacterium]|nr:hypothetical protein [Cyanobacteria bacterium SZAS LIN-5]RTL41157.1 MAG: hypothetical protein EKK48_14560 [Candidatus Melainabacteria bacterium]
MAEKEETELGRSKEPVTPAQHLMHLLTIGWSPTSPLIQRYVAENGLSRDLSQWQAIQGDFASRQPAKPAGKQK